MAPQPGINGVRYAARAGYLYYTSTARKLFMRVPVDPGSHDPAGAPECIASSIVADDVSSTRTLTSPRADATAASQMVMAVGCEVS